MMISQSLGFLHTPPLWHGKQFDIQQFEFPNVDLKTFQPKVIAGNYRLGHQMEYVFKQLIEHSEAYDVILHNLPIRQEKRTLGEIDFILTDKSTDKLIHIELTYKFYIIDPDLSNPEIIEPDPIHSLIGPNRRDSFFLKMGKTKNKQFPLLHSEEAAQALHDIHIDHSEVEQQCCFKAQLYRPYGHESVEIGTLNKECFAGYWLRYDDFNKSEFADAHYYIPTKSEWPIKPHKQVSWKTHHEIIKDINLALISERAPMVWLKSPKGGYEKLFVVWW